MTLLEKTRKINRLLQQANGKACLLNTSPSPRDRTVTRMPA